MAHIFTKIGQKNYNSDTGFNLIPSSHITQGTGRLPLENGELNSKQNGKWSNSTVQHSTLRSKIEILQCIKMTACN